MISFDEYQAYLQCKQGRSRRFTQLREAAAANAAYNQLTEAEALALVVEVQQEVYEQQEPES